MDDEPELKVKDRVWDWLESKAIGRAILALVTFVRRAWFAHIDRYRLWDERFYRICTWVTIAALVLVFAGLFKIGEKHYRHHEEMRAQGESVAFLDRGDYRNAALSASRALMFNPNNLPACRVMAALADQSNSPTVLVWLGRIANNQPTLDNKLQLALAGLRYQPPPFQFSANLLKELEPMATNVVAYQVAAADLAMSLHHLNEAEAHFATAAGLEPNNARLGMSAALLQLLSTNQTEQAKAMEMLDQLRTNGSLSLFALRGLVANRLAGRDLATARMYSDELVADPRATLGDELQNLGILHQLNTSDFPDRLQALETQAMTNQPAVVEVSAWMRNNGLVAENLRWMMSFPVSMLDRPQIQITRSQGYLESSNWSRLREVASQGDWGDLEYLRFALVSHACAQLGEGEMADSSWQAAMKESSSHLADMIKLLDLAESWHLDHEREELLLWMVRDFPDQRWSHKLVQTYFAKGNTLGLHQLYGIMEELSPTNTLCQNDLAATDMLLKINLDQAFGLSAEAYKKNPTNPTVAATYALSLHLQDRDLQAIAVLKELPPASLERPGVALYYGIVLASAGKTSEAMTWLRLAQAKGQFLPEERQLLTTALAEASPTPP